jgi:copper chaperone
MPEVRVLPFTIYHSLFTHFKETIMETVTLKVTGMTCMGCVGSVKRVLQGIDGVAAVEVSLDQAQATVQFDAKRANPTQLKAAIEDAGYEAA